MPLNEGARTKKAAGVKNEDYAYTVFRQRFNCKKIQVLIMAIYEYDNENRLIKSAEIQREYPGMAQWDDMPPDSIGETITRNVCKQN